MELLGDPQAWLSFLLLATLEVVLGIDNIIFLSILVDPLPRAKRRSARFLGLSFAMVTRIALLLSVIWLAGLRRPLFALLGRDVAVRELILFGGGAFLIVKSAMEIRATLTAQHASRKRPVSANGLWLTILQIGLV